MSELAAGLFVNGCRRVAPTGHVTAMDLDARFLRSLDLANLDVREENIVDAQTGTDITQWDRELAELDDPTQLFVSPMTIAVIATKA